MKGNAINHRIAYCPRCGHEQTFKRREVRHRYHAIASALTLGMWLLPWAAITVGRRFAPWECDQCSTPPADTETKRTM